MRIATVAFLLLVGCVSPEYEARFQGLRQRTAELRQGMSQQDVVALLGRPDDRDGGVCGQLVGQPWNCVNWRYFTYVHGTRGLLLRYQVADDGELRVNDWEWQ